MSNGDWISTGATCKHHLQVAYYGSAIVAQNATTERRCFALRYAKATLAERIAFERHENFDAQRREQLAAVKQSDIVELDKIAESSKSLSKRGENEK